MQNCEAAIFDGLVRGAHYLSLADSMTRRVVPPIVARAGMALLLVLVITYWS